MKTLYIVVGGVVVAVAAGAAGYYFGRRHERKRIEDRISDGLDKVVSDVLDDIGVSAELRGGKAQTLTEAVLDRVADKASNVIHLHKQADEPAKNDSLLEFNDIDRRTMSELMGVDFDAVTRQSLLSDTDLVIKLVKSSITMTINAMADEQKATIYVQRMEEVYAGNVNGLLVAGELMTDAVINGKNFVDVLELYMRSLNKMVNEGTSGDADQLRAFVASTNEILPFNVFGVIGE